MSSPIMPTDHELRQLTLIKAIERMQEYRWEMVRAFWKLNIRQSTKHLFIQGQIDLLRQVKKHLANLQGLTKN